MKTNDIHHWGIGLMAFAALCTTACTQETETGIATSDRQAVAFSAQVETQALKRVSSGDYTNWRWDIDDNVKVRKGEETRLYTITSAEGAMSTDELPFLWQDKEFTVNAWYPVDAVVDMTDQSTKERFCQCDLLVAKEQQVTASRHTLTFSHAVTHVEYLLQRYDNYTGEEAEAAKVTFFGYASAAYDEGTSTWGASDASAQPDQIIIPCTEGLSGHALLLPCEMWDKPMIKVEIAGDTYVYIPRDNDEVDMVNGQRMQKGVLKAGAYQKYFLKVSKQGLTVEMASSDVEWGENTDIAAGDVADARFKVHGWEALKAVLGADATIAGLVEGTNDIDHPAVEGIAVTYTPDETTKAGGIGFDGNCIRTRSEEDGKVTFSFTGITTDINLSYMAEYIEVGYYLNNDGTFGSAYEADKAVGVIYKIGAHETDNAAFYEGKLDKIRGYAVALANEGEADARYKWKTGTDALMSADYPEHGKCQDADTKFYLGYGNTVYLQAKDEGYPDTELPANSMAAVRNAAQPVANTSGWYLPSYRQLRDLDVLAGLNIAHFTGLNGTYWCSTFDNDGDNAFKVGFTPDGAFDGSAHYQPVSNDSYVRLILTF